jgi:hypothetical protein
MFEQVMETPLKTVTWERILVNDPYKWAIVKHNPDRPDAYKYNPFAPDEIPMQDRPIGSQLGHGIPVLPPVWSWLYANNSAAAWEWLTNYEKMWINNNGVGGEINIGDNVSAESITGGGNLVAYDFETATHIRLVSFKYTDNIAGSFFTHPWLFWYPTMINEAGIVRKVANGIDVYIPLLRYTELWLRKVDVIQLAYKPASWGIKDVLMYI